MVWQEDEPPDFSSHLLIAEQLLLPVIIEQQAELPGEQTIRLAVIATVLLSIVAHGLSARPFIARYARAVAALPPDAPEHRSGEAAG